MYLFIIPLVHKPNHSSTMWPALISLVWSLNACHHSTGIRTKEKRMQIDHGPDTRARADLAEFDVFLGQHMTLEQHFNPNI